MKTGGMLVAFGAHLTNDRYGRTVVCEKLRARKKVLKCFEWFSLLHFGWLYL